MTRGVDCGAGGVCRDSFTLSDSARLHPPVDAAQPRTPPQPSCCHTQLALQPHSTPPPLLPIRRPHTQPHHTTLSLTLSPLAHRGLPHALSPLSHSLLPSLQSPPLSSVPSGAFAPLHPHVGSSSDSPRRPLLLTLSNASRAFSTDLCSTLVPPRPLPLPCHRPLSSSS